ncbi:rho GTPase-activating protein SYDE1 isoform X2 [Triplophysa dalaica]|uniref:rho GTPase-activating protein SYDE1 isoform X2 n=1 Tax=Triplophysa dalaica TaxID=1582913 RepID=UPI0024DFBB33|nr:rho GTPase-activating protein SYDE1 isoform X2 [Triplophysa dalaica]
MAEPLLKRTFSKLRGKDRFRRKTEPKLTATGKVDLIQSSSSSTSSAGPVETEPMEECTRRSHITVSKIQNWAKLSSVCREPAPPGLVYGPQDRGQRTLSEDVSKRNDVEMGYSGTPNESVDAGVPELSPLSTDVCVSPTAAKTSGQGAYLQHLDSSSRAWVLSTGKPQTSDQPLQTSIGERRQGARGDSNIWYNPIPEEEDGEKYGDPWRKRETERSARGLAGDVEPETSSDAVMSECASRGTPDSPGGPSGSGMSVIDKIKSPGTVRRLSMKMRKLPELRRKLSLRSSRNQRHAQGNAGGAADDALPPNASKESSNVISRYHLDTSAPTRPTRRSSRTRSASKGGYLSDGDSPELLPKQASGQPATTLPHGGVRESPAITDMDSFRLYSLTDLPRCAQRLSGLLTVHLLGVEELRRSPRRDATKEVFCAIQVDGVTQARTSLLTCRGPRLPLNHTFNLELERARLLKLVIMTPSGADNGPSAPARNRVCCVGAVAIPPLFKASRCQQLCVKLEPRGLLYVKLTLLEHFVSPFPRLSDLSPPSVFGVELKQLVEKETSAVKVPLLIQKCVCEIERRGLRVVGLYRLCGSAAVKKELRDAFERDSAAVVLDEELYPDVNVITGILKDYLRELPSALITRTLYEVVLEDMMVRPACRSDSDTHRSHNTISLLQCLPEPERATLSFLLDHLSLVASFSDSNRMTCQNLAVCFGPVLLTPSQECWQAGLTAPGSGPLTGVSRGGRGFAHSEDIASAVDFKRHIEALHYLLKLWPVPKGRVTEDSDQSPHASQNSSLRRAQRVQLRVDLPSAQDAVVVSRRGRGRLESPPCNRYAGDWSVCGRDFLSNDEADYDEVAGSESDDDIEQTASPDGLFVDDFALDFDAPFTCRLSLKDFDTLISDLERELAKQINICL